MPEPAEPTGVDEMPAQLRREVRLLGDLLGQTLVEAEGPDLFEDVERLRHATIDLRGSRGAEREALARRVVELIDSLELDRAGSVARAFTVYFQLVNLAEERHRVRVLRERSHAPGQVRESLAATAAELRDGVGEAAFRELLTRLEVTPVLTAHPTEARRRAIVDELRSIGDLVDRLDDPRLSTGERTDAERGLREHAAILWRTSQLRRQRPSPLDEVRTVMSVFDETLFQIAPLLYRELDRATAGEASGAAPPDFPAFLRWGSWVGGDRDGNPSVTHEVTRGALEIQADHVLRGLENAARRIGRSLTASEESTPPSPELAAALAGDEAAFPELAEEIRVRSPGEPHRRRLLMAADRLAATRRRAPGGYDSPAAFLAELRALQDSLAGAGARRLAYGDLQHLVWQVETFGFHLASLELRQHSLVHEAALGELAPDAVGDAAALDRLAGDPAARRAEPVSDAAREMLATLAVMAELQSAWGVEACRRYVVSFTRSAADVVAVRALARLAVPDGSLEPDVVPLFESRADLEAAVGVLDALLELPGWRAWLERRGRRLEVMLGYSDAAKDAGFLAANLALYRAQGALVAWARRHGVRITLFHGRGGAVGRGGGPAGRAIRSQAPGSVEGGFKVTEQGEVIFARYGNAAIGLRHLEQVASAVLAASTPAHEAALADAERRFAGEAALMAGASEAAYRDLVGRPGFAEFFARVSPLEEISQLRIGSRPARRGGHGLAELRAIPWVFAWAQNRCNLPGWYGLGSGLEAVAERQGVERLRRMAAEWPFFSSLLDNAEMSLAKADPMIAGLYLELGGRPDLVEMIREEFRRTRRLVARVTGHDRMLAGRPVLRRAVDLRNPYVDALSFLQLRFLRELRRGAAADPARLADLVLLTVNGVAAGLQNTG
jgi:phosphoenolpyruvate carboxylase